jgi:hypothetical protein
MECVVPSANNEHYKLILSLVVVSVTIQNNGYILYDIFTFKQEGFEHYSEKIDENRAA